MLKIMAKIDKVFTHTFLTLFYSVKLQALNAFNRLLEICNMVIFPQIKSLIKLFDKIYDTSSFHIHWYICVVNSTYKGK